MNIYHKYASRENEPLHSVKNNAKSGNTDPKLRPLCGQFDIFGSPELLTKQITQWQAIFPQAAFFAGNDAFFGPVVTMVFKNEQTSKLSTMSITKFGCNVFDNLMLDSSSRFWPACENLSPEYRDSNVRKALAITNLKNYNKLWKNKGQVPVTLEWDETDAGRLASTMCVLLDRTPEQLGAQLLSLGLLQDQSISSTLIDVVYNNRDPEGGAKTVLENNKIVLLLGEQMNHLFDPLLEYSPQTLEYEYVAPSSSELPVLHHNQSVQAIVQELLDVQTHFTMALVSVLQDFVIPLRIHVLNSSSNSTLGITKVNMVFPPTIDEVTRVNCIAHDTLLKAQKHGYVEVFKVIATMLPFFYNAFVRHQANLTKFHTHYSKFVSNNEERVFRSSEINKGAYSVRAIESVITESMFELPRMKLILTRLYEAIGTEKEKSGVKNADDAESEILSQNYRVAIEIIDSFGYNETQPEKSKNRIFTPSGKLLTELATGWPTELQYGWMDRKVVGIFQLRNVMRSGNRGNEILIIFSDHLLFIEVGEETGEKPVLLLPEVLMNSLINSKPLPRFSQFPNLKVKYWCDIDNLVVREYESETELCLCFTTYGRNHFRDKDENKVLYVQNYTMAPAAEGKSACRKIMELISKAQVLSKSVPFHLFKSDDKHLQTFYCAHEKEEYGSECSKSPVVIMFNMEADEISSVFDRSGSAYFVYNVAFLNDHTLQLTGYSRNKMEECDVDEIVSIEDFSGTLKESLYQSLEAMFHSSFLSPVTTSANLQFLNYFLQDLEQKRKSLVGQTETEADGLFSIDAYPETTEDLYVTEQKDKPVSSEKQQKVPNENRRSVLGALLGKLKRKHTTAPKESTKKAHFASNTKGSLNSKNIPETAIPRGRKLVYKKLYRPIPRLRESSVVSSVVSSPKTVVQHNGSSQAGKRQVSGAAQSRAVSTNTNASSYYTERSLDVTSKFMFPIGEEYTMEEHTVEEQTMDERNMDEQNTEEPNVAESRPLSEVPRMFPQLRETNEYYGHSSPHNLLTNTGYQVFTADMPELAVMSVCRLKSLDSATTIRMSRSTTLMMAEKEASESGEHHELQRPANSQSAPKQSPPYRFSQIDPIELPVTVLGSETNTADPTSVPETLDLAILILVSEDDPAGAKKQIIPGELRIAENTHAEIAQPARRVFSSHDVALALDKINASGISPEVYAKYKQYDDVPVSTFYSDGEKNWVIYTRDNSSNLQAEIQAMKEEVNMDTLDVIDVRSASMMMPSAVQFDSSDGTFSSIEVATYVHEPTEAEVSEIAAQIPKEQSVQSITSTEFIHQFANRLVSEFHLESDASLPLDQLRRESELHSSVSRNVFTNDNGSRVSAAGGNWNAQLVPQLTVDDYSRKSLSSLNIPLRSAEMPIGSNSLTYGPSMPLGAPSLMVGTPSVSSEDEYFSSNDFATALDYYTIGPQDVSDTFTSSSSERTLMNERAAPKDTHETGFESLRLESIAYLTEILNGTLEI